MPTPSNQNTPPISATQLRVQAQRRQEGAASVIYTPDLIAILDASAGVSSAYSIVMTGPNGKIDPSLLPSTTGLVIEVNGFPTPVQNILNLIAGTGMAITADNFGGITFVATGS